MPAFVQYFSLLEKKVYFLFRAGFSFLGSSFHPRALLLPPSFYLVPHCLFSAVENNLASLTFGGGSEKRNVSFGGHVATSCLPFPFVGILRFRIHKNASFQSKFAGVVKR